MPSTCGTSSPTASSPPASRSFNRIHPDALIVGALPPPPAYSPSPSPFPPPQAVPLPQSPQDSRSYNTFGQRGLEHHLEQGYLPNGEPQDMGRPEGEPNESTPLASVQVKKSSRRRSAIAKILFVALVLTVLSTFLTAVLNWKDSVCIAHNLLEAIDRNSLIASWLWLDLSDDTIYMNPWRV